MQSTVTSPEQAGDEVSDRKQQILEMLKSEPTDIFLRYGLAMEHVSEGDDAGAIGCFRELLEIAPDYVPAYLQISQAYVRHGATDQARAQLQCGIEVAHRQNESHAAEEMAALLATLT
jgi:cytochrome c-type biogenesis protein CcmH/NrfG